MWAESAQLRSKDVSSSGEARSVAMSGSVANCAARGSVATPSMEQRPNAAGEPRGPVEYLVAKIGYLQVSLFSDCRDLPKSDESDEDLG